MVGKRTLIALAGAALAVAVAVGGAAARSQTVPACGDTITANLLLTGDMNCSGGGTNGLDVGASGITLNLNGHTITGGGGSNGYFGIYVGDYNHVKVINGTIKNFSRAIFLDGEGGDSSVEPD